jgi:hypothetical protein
MLLAVIAGISLGVAAAALPPLIEGPFQTWLYPAKLAMWLAGIAAIIVEYLAVLFGSRLYLRRVEVYATTSLALVFLAIAGMFIVLGMGSDLLGTRWFALFAIFNLFAGLEADHARRVVLRHAGDHFGSDVVRVAASSLLQVTWLHLVTALGSLLFAVLGSGAPAFGVFVAACVALASTIATNVQQYRLREDLARHGVISGRPKPAPSEGGSGEP